MFPGVDKLEKGRVRAPSRSETVLGIRQYTVSFPRPGDSGYNEAYPELPNDLKEDEGSEPVQSDLGLGVLGLGTKPSPLEPGPVGPIGRRDTCGRRHEPWPANP